MKMAIKRLAYSIAEAGALLGFGRSKSYEMAASGVMPTRVIAGSKRVIEADLEAMIARLPVDAPRAER